MGPCALAQPHYKEQLQDANYGEGVCACCARGVRKINLVQAVFPPPDSEVAPAWLDWSTDAWLEQGVARHAALAIDDVQHSVFVIGYSTIVTISII